MSYLQDKQISFMVAKLAKEKGFNGFYEADYYDKDGNDWPGFSSNMKDYEDKYVKASQSLIQKWLREEHRIQIEIPHYTDCATDKEFDDGLGSYGIEIHEPKTQDECSIFVSGKFYETYEEALEVGLIESLKLI